MKELFDVHCHMVPGVDDGAADLEESLAMLKMQHEDGVRKIIITPHYRRRMFETPAKKVHEQFLKLQEAAKKEYPDMSLYLGCELHSNMDLQDILEKRKYVTMAGSSYVLLEFSEGDSAQHIRERVYNVLSCGYEPIIAHVERYQATVKSVGFSSDLVDMGARLQVNVESILGKYTWGAKRYCRKLMKEDLLGFVGSDSHNTKTRIPNIGAGAAYVSKKMGEAYAERIFHDNPMEILRDAGNVAISLQGVSTWKGIQNEILHIMDSRPVRKIYLFYDSDMLGNTAVYNQSIALLKAIEITFPTIQTYHAVWKKEWGKGIDDMYFNGHIKKIKYLTSGQLKSCHEKVLKFLLKKYGVESLDEIVRSKDKDLKERFCRDLQDNSEKAIFDGEA